MRCIRRLILVFTALTTSTLAHGGPALTSTIRENFNGILLTAAYSTVIGGAVGAAALAFEKAPKQKLRYIPVGAAIGFLSGTLLGTYIVFVPSFGKSNEGKKTDYDDLEGFSQLPIISNAPSVLALNPHFDLEKRRIDGWGLNWTIALF